MITGRIALRSPWRNTTRPSASPLARAVRTKSSPSTSTIDDRVMRASIAIRWVPTASDGKTIASGPTSVGPGNQPSVMKPHRMSSGANIICGTEIPESEIVVASVSTQVPRRIAATMPSGSASAIATSMPHTASAIVCGMTSAIRCATVGPLGSPLRHWLPSVPSTTWPRKRPNWTGRGWSRPMHCSIFLRAPGGASPPAR